jgi:hypothetical protein
MLRRAFLLLVAAAATLPVSAAPRAIPGITAKDAFPQACVSCHIKEHRISAMLAKLPKKHPSVNAKDIPASCMKCHAKTSKIAFAPIMHRKHLGADTSEFLVKFDGECTHCHKLDRKTGLWTMPSAAEK